MNEALPDRTPDRLGRPLRSLRLSVTDRCNLRCRYCMPSDLFGPDFAFLPRSEILSFEEIVRLARAMAGLGVDSIKITGGEPLLRRDIGVLIRQLRAINEGIDLSLTTNGLRLEKEAEGLREAGLDRINVSLDSINPEAASRMAGRPVNPEVIWGNILLARDLGLQVKVNTVIQRGVNEGEILPLAGRCRSAGIPLRFIEYMDVGTANDWRQEAVYTGAEVRRVIGTKWPLEPVRDPRAGETARRFRYTDGAGEVGFINSISEPFCSSCGRLRLSADGTLYTCLFAEQGTPLKPWLREERLDQEEIRSRILALWLRRSDRYSEVRSRAVPQSRSSRPEMWAIGG